MDLRKAPLASYRVVDLTRYLAGPIPTMFLADLGAQVIKVETAKRPDALRRGRPVDPEKPLNEQHPQAHNVWRGKRSVTLDIGLPEGREALLDLISVSDIVVENFAHGVMEKLGLGYETLRSVRPDVVLLSIRAFVGGRLRGFRAGAPQIQALAGLNTMVGYSEGESLTLGRYSVDLFTGMNAFCAVAAALHRRRLDGRGDHIEVCLTKSAFAAFAPAFLEYSCTGRVPVPRGNYDPWLVPYNFFPCLGEEEWVSIAVGTEQEWVGLCEALGQPQLGQDPRFMDLDGRLRNRRELEGLISGVTVEYDATTLEEMLQAHGVPAARLLRAQDRLDSGHFQAREVHSWVEHPVLGQEPLFGSGWKMSETPPRIRGPAPLLGEHNGWALGELLGVSKARMAELASSDVTR